MKIYEQVERISWPVSCLLEENLASLMANRGIWYGYGSLDLSRERDEMLARDKLEEDRRCINLMCSELYSFNKFVTTQPSATDEITSYFRGFGTSQRIPLWLVFAVELMVDMKWVLQAHIHHKLEDLTAASSRGMDSVRQYFRESSELSSLSEYSPFHHVLRAGDLFRLLGHVF